MSKFSKDDRVITYVACYRSILGTVADDKTRYNMVHVLWDEPIGVESDRVYPHDLEIITPEEERTADIEEAQRLLAKHGLSFDTPESIG